MFPVIGRVLVSCLYHSGRMKPSYYGTKLLNILVLYRLLVFSLFLCLYNPNLAVKKQPSLAIF